jgi:hypothetical protein
MFEVQLNNQVLRLEQSVHVAVILGNEISN